MYLHQYYNSPKGSQGRPRWQCHRICLPMQETQRCRFQPWVGMISGSKKWQPTPIFLPGKFHGQRSLAGYSPWGHKELDMTEWLSTHTHTHIARKDLGLQDHHSLECVSTSTPAFQIHVPEAGRDSVPQTPCFLHWSFPILSPQPAFPKALESELRGLRFWQVPQCRLKRDTCPADGGGAKDLHLLGFVSPMAQQ